MGNALHTVLQPIEHPGARHLSISPSILRIFLLTVSNRY